MSQAEKLAKLEADTIAAWNRYSEICLANSQERNAAADEYVTLADKRDALRKRLNLPRI